MTLISGDQGSIPSSDVKWLCDPGEDTPPSQVQFHICEVGLEGGEEEPDPQSAFPAFLPVQAFLTLGWGEPSFAFSRTKCLLVPPAACFLLPS